MNSLTGRAAPTEQQVQAAEALGEQHGKARASWTFDGNTNRGTYQKCLDLHDEGDPLWDNLFGAPSPLSGEWADDPSPADILAELGAEDESLLARYEDAFYMAYRDTVLAAARYHVGEEE